MSENNVKQNGEIKKLLRKIIPQMAVINVLCFGVTLLWGFDIRDLMGFLVGYAYVVACYIYLGKTINRCVAVGNVKKAKKSMTACYAARFAGLFVLGFISFEFDIFSPAGILIPQLYPKIILYINQFTHRKEKADG